MKAKRNFSAILLAATLLSGCVTMPTGQFDNRISCDPSMREMFVGSKYGPLYVGSDVKKEDGELACQAILLLNIVRARQPAEAPAPAAKPPL